MAHHLSAEQLNVNSLFTGCIHAVAFLRACLARDFVRWFSTAPALHAVGLSSPLEHVAYEEPMHPSSPADRAQRAELSPSVALSFSAKYSLSSGTTVRSTPSTRPPQPVDINGGRVGTHVINSSSKGWGRKGTTASAEGPTMYWPQVRFILGAARECGPMRSAFGQ
ncbi:hypothetical protein B0H14DRAFT_3466100 [Mycena olivaceomarginata]|nr:hypothetical protein B0H14DRAFT_3466100 [Mycena olivaceomarginata]